LGQVGRAVPDVAGHMVRWAVALTLAAVLAAVLAGCGVSREQAATSLGEVRVMTTAVPATPTPGATASPLLYVPVIIQGIPLEPTPVATRRPGDPPPRLPADSVVVTHAISQQQSTADGLVLQVEGEVINNSPNAVQGVRIVVSARSWAGETCGRGALTLLGKAEAVVEAGESWPFAGTVVLSCGADSVNVDTMALQTGVWPLRVVLEGVSVGVGPNGEWQLQGTMRNDSGSVVAFPRVVVTLRRSQGEYLTGAVAYASVETLEVGQTAPFTVSIPPEKITGWAGYSAIGTGERR